MTVGYRDDVRTEHWFPVLLSDFGYDEFQQSDGHDKSQRLRTWYDRDRQRID